MTVKELLTLEKLHRLYDKNRFSKPLVVNSKCSMCGKPVDIEIHRTSDGFGLKGGALYSSHEEKLLAKCMICLKA